MNQYKNQLNLYGLIGLLFFVCCLFPKMIAFAGGINANEAGVISAASGTFTYNGKTYRAGSAYINQLVSYLSGDDVDLTAEQASEAISQMYGSIAQGVEEGYLYEVGADTTEGTSGTENDTGTEDGSEDGSTTESNLTTEKTTEEPSDEEDYADAENETEKDPSQQDIWETPDEKTVIEKKLEQRPTEKDATATVQLEKEKIVVTTKDNTEIRIEKNGKILSNRFLRMANWGAGILLAITILCGIVLFVTKCMSFRRTKNRRIKPGHSKRRKVRRYTRNILTVALAFNLIGCFLLLGIYVGLFNEKAIMQNMQSSGYFQYAYSEYITEMAEKQEDIQPYEEYRFFIKQNSLKILEGETDVRIPDSNVTPYIYNLKKNYMELLRVAGSLLLGSVLLNLVLMIFMDMRRERSIKSFAAAELTASVIMIAFTTIMAVNKPYLQLYIQPDYLYLFLMECIHWMVKVMTSIAAFSMVVGMVLVGIYRTMVNSR